MELQKTGLYTKFFTEEERKQLIGSMLSKVRKAAKLSQKEVAAIVGVSQATYSTYERGRSEPPAEILVRLSHLYQCPIDMLVQRDRTEKGLDESDEKMQAVKAQIEQLEQQIGELDDGAIKETAQMQMDLLKRLVETYDRSCQSYRDLLVRFDGE